jgi:glutathione S-transferase
MSAPEFVTIAEGRKLSGLRLALTQGVPGPWSVAAKSIMEVKGIPFKAVPQLAAQLNEELQEWTGHTNAPIAIYNDERPRVGWVEILLLAERLAPEPALIPASPEQRALMFGLAHEICGEQGYGWCARALLFAIQEEAGEGAYTSLKNRYSSGESPDQCAARINAIISMFERQMERQAEAGSDYLIGDSLTALDIYWMAFSNMMVAMEPDMCIMPDFYKQIGPTLDTRLERPTPAILIEHRNRIARRHLSLPIEC